MRFTALENEAQLKQIETATGHQAVLKHNTSCPISKGVLASLQAGEEVEGLDTLYVLDLLAHRPLSNALAKQYGVEHQSPQLLIIRNGKCVYDQFGYDISPQSIREALAE
jgi:bacillithiol system protein YtxJ